MEDSLKFYNQFFERLIKDYTKGNKRVVNAIENLALYIPENAESILDIGCGLGWSSYEFSRYFKNTAIKGIDLSPVLIEKASILFSNDNLSFEVFDITKDLPQQAYDAIVMIDVYEHIPVEDRSNFHNSIKKLMKPNGRLILACPSKYHQGYLRSHNPKGLQPVDEDVDIETIQTIAKDINGEVVLFEYQAIWKPLDYFYAVIETDIRYGYNLPLKSNRHLKVEEKSKRIKRVKSTFGVEFPKEQIKLITFLKRFSNKLKK